MNKKTEEIQRLLRPDQGGDVITEFAIEVAFPFVVFSVFAILALLVVIF